MQFGSLENPIGEYLESEHFVFLQGPVKEEAVGILHAFAKACEEKDHNRWAEVTARDVDVILLEQMTKLNLPHSIKKGIPDLIVGFLEFLALTGQAPGAMFLKEVAEALKPKFISGLREDGSVRGETYVKKGSNTGRNDPCPCGSGKKFKKCCGPLIGL